MAKLWINKSSKQKAETPKGVISPPVSYETLIEAYYGNPYHASCIDVKASNVIGNGFKDRAIADILSKMSLGDSIFSLLEKTVRDLLIFGNAFWETPKDEVYQIPAWTMYRTEKGWEQRVGKDKEIYDPEEVWHFRRDSMLSSFYGTPDYLSILPSLDLMRTITSYNSNFFENNAIPDFAIVVEGGTLSPQAESSIQRFMRSKFRGTENAHKTLYLPVPEGVKVRFEKLQAESMKDMQFLELRKACIGEIISCHGVPPRLMGIMVPGELGGGGETSGERDIFFQTRIKPLQNSFCGQLDAFFLARLGRTTDIELESFDYSENTGDLVLKALKGN
ncbi:MAG: phage portal protein [Candidatus Cloacimonadaceae bacterium]|nr:phage portal protein [Candidatus Cloacimonadaceae bacterium]